MNWEVLGSVGELVGALAVVVSLIYLAMQVRQNTSALEVSTHQDLIANQLSAQSIIGANPQVADLMTRADQNYDGLTEAEHKQFSHICFSLINVFQSARFNYEAGLFKIDLWNAWVRGYYVLINTSPAFHREWQTMRELYTPNIRKVVDEIIENDNLLVELAA